MKSSAFRLTLACLALTVVPTGAAVQPALKPQATPLPLNDVRLLGGPLKNAQDLTADYLLKLEPDRMLYFLRLRAGLQPKAKEPYGGWDGEGRQLTGHICGHYLSAVSYMWSATGDLRFKERVDYIVSELKAIQDQHGDGYIGGLLGNPLPGVEGGTVPDAKQFRDGKFLFEQLANGKILSGGFDLNGMWSPWYVQHKLYAGLRDAYRQTGNQLALQVEVRFAEWADHILSRLSREQIQQMLATEFGAMNESMVDLYADTGDPRWLRAADYFQHDAIVNPLARHEDILAGTHGNTQVPKLLGSLVRFEVAGEVRDGYAAAFFWDRVVKHHSFATGGHGRNEYFGRPDQFQDMIDGRTAETCNVYNMLKLTRRLFALWPDGQYADFHERALFNHILGSIDPVNGRTCYMLCVGASDHQREYQDPFRDFTCCVGTGFESHALHADGIYYEAADRLWVNLYVPSRAQWKQAGVTLTASTTFPEGETARFELGLEAPRRFTLSLRRPAWAEEGFSVSVNGEPIPTRPRETTRTRSGRGGHIAPLSHSGYVDLSREWKQGDVVEVRLPRKLRLETIPDNPRRSVVLWGPLVLAGDLSAQAKGSGSAPADRLPDSVLLAGGRSLAEWLKPVEGAPGHFLTVDTGTAPIRFEPFYRLHHRKYGVYWDLFTPEEWAAESARRLAAEEKKQRLQAATVAFVQPGEMQPERDFNFQGEDSSPVRPMDRPGRKGTKWFSFEVPVDPAHPMVLIATFFNDEPANRSFELSVDGQRIAEPVVSRRSPEQVVRFQDMQFPLPADLVTGKQTITVRFQAKPGSEIATLFGLRIVRGDQPR